MGDEGGESMKVVVGVALERTSTEEGVEKSGDGNTGSSVAVANTGSFDNVNPASASGFNRPLSHLPLRVRDLASIPSSGIWSESPEAS